MSRERCRLVAVAVAVICMLPWPALAAGAEQPSGSSAAGGSTVGPAPRFSDLGGYGWAAAAIDALARRGIVDGVAPGRFDPGGPVTRAQLAALLTRTFGLGAPRRTSGRPAATHGTFADVPKGFWGYAAIEAAAPYMGATGPTFRPEAPVSRLVAAAVLGRLEVARGLAQAAAGAIWSRFGDGTQVPASLAPYAGVPLQSGIFTGYPDGTFRPERGLDRAEAAVVLARLLQRFPGLAAGPPAGASTSGPAAASASASDATAAVPQVTGVSPASGPETGGTLVQIAGSGFTGSTAVRFGLTSASGFAVESDTRIVALSPPMTGTGQIDVTVTGRGGTSAVAPADDFSFVDSAAGVQVQTAATPYAAPVPVGGPTIRQVSPASGPQSGGNTVTISGSGFTPGTQVYFGVAKAADVQIVARGTLAATAPPGQGSVPVTVVTAYGSTTGASDGHYDYTAGPYVSGISPGAGPGAGGTSVTITGYGLAGVTAVDFGGQPATDVQAQSDWIVTAVSPPGTGTVSVSLQTPSGQASGTPIGFTYEPGNPPAVLSVSPNTGPSTGGTVVTIRGTGFAGATSVQFGTAGASAMVVVSDGQIVATSPPGTGTVDVTVTSPNGTSEKVWRDQFGYFGSSYDCSTVSGAVYCTLQ